MTSCHEFILRVYYEDTDAQKIVYYANYLRFMERARTEMLRDLGFSHAQDTTANGQFFVVGDAYIRYKTSARLDDELIVASSVMEFGNASLKLRQNVLKRLAGQESLLVEGVITLIYITEQGRPMRIPDTLRQALHHYQED